MQGATGGKLIETGTETVKEFAARHGKSGQTVLNWIKKGKVPAIRSGRGFVIETDAADAALRATAGGSAHGGTRAGAGRPRDSTPNQAQEQADRRAAPTFIEAQAAIRERADAGLYPDDAVRATEILNATRDELGVFLSHAEVLGLTQAKLDWMERVEKIRKLNRENDTAEGKLLNAEDAKAAFAEANEKIRASLEGVPARVGTRLSGVAWPTGEAIDEVADLMRAAGADADTVRAMRGILAKPGDLAEALAMGVAAEIDRVREKIAGDTP